MPVRRVKGGYRWGKHGKVYKSKAGAERQARAAFANGWRGDAFGTRARRTAMAVALQASKRAEDRYVRDLRGFFRSFHRLYERLPLPHMRQDAEHPFKATIDHLDVLVRSHIPAAVGPLFGRMALTVREANRKVYPNLFGIRPTDTRLAGHIDVARDANIKLVEDAHREYARDVREIIDDSANFGLRVEDVRKQLLDRGNVSESRASLIARDQTLKLNGDINRIRQTNAGVKEYVWSTSRDERVRESHRELDGRTFSWDNPPVVDGEQAHPGEPVQCRCIAVAIVPEFEDIF